MENQNTSHIEDVTESIMEDPDEHDLSSDSEGDDDDEDDSDGEIDSEDDGEDEGDEEGEVHDEEEEEDADGSEDEEEDEDEVDEAEAGEEEAYASSGDETSERCPICLNCLREQDLGMPEACDHRFCLECIQEWSKNVNTCPVDRQVFNIILAKHAGEEKVYRQIPVENRQQLQEEEEAAGAHDETVCEVCGLADREDRLLLCDSCDAGYHCDCLDPPLARVPVHEWFCPDCRPQQNTVEEEPQQHGRQIARTRVSERVRRIIADARAERAERRRIVAQRIAHSDNFMDDVPPLPGPSRSSSARRGTKRKRTTKRKTASKKRKTTRKKRATKKKTPGKRSRRKRKTKKKSPSKRKSSSSAVSTLPAMARTVQTSATVKGRIADKLGLKPPPKGRSIPLQRASNTPSAPGGSGSSGRHEAAPSFSILGNKDELYSFAEYEGEERIPVHRPAIPASSLSRSALSSHKPLSLALGTSRRSHISVTKQGGPLATTTTAQSSAVNFSKTADSEVKSAAPASFDLLGSIMSNQDLLHKGSQHITIRRDGSLTAAPTSLEVHAASRNIKLDQSSPSKSTEDNSIVGDTASKRHSISAGKTEKSPAKHSTSTSQQGNLSSTVRSLSGGFETHAPSSDTDISGEKNLSNKSQSLNQQHKDDSAIRKQISSLDTSPAVSSSNIDTLKLKINATNCKEEIDDPSFGIMEEQRTATSHYSNSGDFGGVPARTQDIPTHASSIGFQKENNAGDGSGATHKDINLSSSHAGNMESDRPDHHQGGHHSQSSYPNDHHSEGSSRRSRKDKDTAVSNLSNNNNSSATLDNTPNLSFDSSNSSRFPNNLISQVGDNEDTHCLVKDEASQNLVDMSFGNRCDMKLREQIYPTEAEEDSFSLNENEALKYETEHSPQTLPVKENAGSVGEEWHELDETKAPSDVDREEDYLEWSKEHSQKEVSNAFREQGTKACFETISIQQEEPRKNIGIDTERTREEGKAWNETALLQNEQGDNFGTYGERKWQEDGREVGEACTETNSVKREVNVENLATYSERTWQEDEIEEGETCSETILIKQEVQAEKFETDRERIWQEDGREDGKTCTETISIKQEVQSENFATDEERTWQGDGREEGEASDSGEEGELKNEEDENVMNFDDYEEGEIIDEEDRVQTDSIVKEEPAENPPEEKTQTEENSGKSSPEPDTWASSFENLLSKEVGVKESNSSNLDKAESEAQVEDNIEEEVEEDEEEDSTDNEFDPGDKLIEAFMIGKLLDSLRTNQFDRRRDRAEKNDSIRRRKEEAAKRKELAELAAQNAKISILDFIGNASAKKFGVYAPPASSKKSDAPATSRVEMPGRGRGRGSFDKDSGDTYRSREQNLDNTKDFKPRGGSSAYYSSRKDRDETKRKSVRGQYHSRYAGSRRRHSRTKSPSTFKSHRVGQRPKRHRSKSGSPHISHSKSYRRRIEKQYKRRHAIKGEEYTFSSDSDRDIADEKDRKWKTQKRKKLRQTRPSPEMNGSMSSNNGEGSNDSSSSEGDNEDGASDNGKANVETDSDDEVLAKRSSPLPIPQPAQSSSSISLDHPASPANPSTPPSPPAFSPVGPLSPSEPPPPPPSPPQKKRQKRLSVKQEVDTQYQPQHHSQAPMNQQYPQQYQEQNAHASTLPQPHHQPQQGYHQHSHYPYHHNQQPPTHHQPQSNPHHHQQHPGAYTHHPGAPDVHSQQHPGTHPQHHPGTHPQHHPGTHPHHNPGAHPHHPPGTHPQRHSGNHPQHLEAHHQHHPGPHLQQHPDAHPQQHLGYPQQHPVTLPQQLQGAHPQQQPGTYPQHQGAHQQHMSRPQYNTGMQPHVNNPGARHPYPHTYISNAQHPHYMNRPAQPGQYGHQVPNPRVPSVTQRSSTPVHPSYQYLPASGVRPTHNQAYPYQPAPQHPGYMHPHTTTAVATSAAPNSTTGYAYGQQAASHATQPAGTNSGVRNAGYTGYPVSTTSGAKAGFSQDPASVSSGYQQQHALSNNNRPSSPTVSSSEISRRSRVSSYRISPSEPSFKGVATSDRIASNLLLDEVKKGFRTLVEDAVRSALKPAWSTKRVTKDEYKDIFKRAVDKVCGSKETVVQQDKIQFLVEAYVAKARKTRTS